MLARGNARQGIALNDFDRTRFVDVLGGTAERYVLIVYAWCLMPNHYHLLVETPRGNLSRAIHHLNGVYAQGFNRRHDRAGHLLEGRYKAILVQREAHLLELARYIVLNPVRAGLCDLPEEFRWSSFRATAGFDAVPPFLSVGPLLARFGTDASRCRLGYRQFVAEGIGIAGVPTEPRGVVLGDDAFLARALARNHPDPEIPRAQRAPARPALSELLALGGEKAIADAYREHGYTLAEIAGHLGCHYSTVSRRLRTLEREDSAPPRGCR